MFEKKNFFHNMRKFASSVFAFAILLTAVNPTVISAQTEISSVTGKTSDAVTLYDYKNVFKSEINSTENTGIIWSDKTVFSGNEVIDDGKGTIQVNVDPTVGEDFNVVFSALSSTKEIIGKSQVGFDVSFVLDISLSMKDDDKLYNAIAILDSTVDSLMQMSPYNRISLTLFDTNAKTILPLDHYTKVNDEGYFGKVVPDQTTGSYSYGVNVKGSDGIIYAKKIDLGTGTNTQMGYAEGMKVLENEPETTFEYEGKTIKRIPTVILLSDGQPTYSSQDPKWWNPDSSFDVYGDGGNAFTGNGMLAMMLAAYKKEKINQHYQTEGPDKDLNIFTIGFGIEGLKDAEKKALAEITLNPKEKWDSRSAICRDIRNVWENYAVGKKNLEIKVEYGPTYYQINHPDGLDIRGDMLRNYVDRYYSASNAEELKRAFESIIGNISLSKTNYPTEIEFKKNPLNSGYITYTDPIGEYMEVKDVKSIIYDGQAYDVVDNHDGTYTCNATVNQAIYGELNLKNVIIKTQSDASGNQTLIIKVPAAAIPLVKNRIELNSLEEISAHEQIPATPIRVVYSVGLKQNINRQTLEGVDDDYIMANLTEDGNVKFYSNHYTNGNEYGDADVSFEASINNSNYYIQKPQILKDVNDNPVGRIQDIQDNQTYHYEIEHYLEENVTTERIEILGKEIKQQEIDFYLEERESKVSIKPGATRHGRLKTLYKQKDVNPTNTATNSYYPSYDDNQDIFNFYQGNNGLLQIKKIPALIISKTVETSEDFVAPSKEFEFKVTLASKTGKTVNAKVNGLDKELTFDSNGVATFKLKNNETIVIPDKQNSTYTVEEINIPTGFTSNYSITNNKVEGTIGVLNEKVQFINNYHPSEITISSENLGFPQIKTITGREFKSGDEFAFTISSENGNLPENPTVKISPTSGYTANIDFGKFVFDKPGTYLYTMTEVDPTTSESDLTVIPGIKYSSQVYNLKVYIIDFGGTLGLDTSVNNGKGYIIESQKVENGTIKCETVDQANFINEYTTKPTSLSDLTFSKKLVGRDTLDNEEYSFIISSTNDGPLPSNTTVKVGNLKNGVAQEFTFGEIKYGSQDVGNTYHYEIREVIPAEEDKKPNVTYDDSVKSVDVLVSDDGNGQIEVSLTYNQTDNEFVNEYKPTPVELNGVTVNKVFEGRPENKWLTSDEFTFTITYDNVSTNDAVVLSNPSLTITDETVDYKDSFGAITFNKAGVYNFKIQETNELKPGIQYDNHTEIMSVTVNDDGLGNLTIADGLVKEFTFKNTYSLNDITLVGANSLKFSKEIEGRDWLDTDSFTFKFEAVTEGAPMPSIETQTVTIGKNNPHTFNFGDIKYTSEDLGGASTKTFEYKVYEDGSSHDNLQYDKAERLVKVTVTDNKDGNLAVSSSLTGNQKFTNIYTSSINYAGINVNKTLVGHDMKANAFEFEITPKNDDSKAKLGAETVKFKNPAANDGETATMNVLNNLTFNQEDANKTFTYDIQEVIPTQDNTYTYDETVYTVSLSVNDDHKGNITVAQKVTKLNENGEAVDTGNKIEFINKYTTNEVNVTIDATKELLNGELIADQFEFKVKDTKDTTVSSGKNGEPNTEGKGVIGFSPINYTLDGIRADVENGIASKKIVDKDTIYTYIYKVEEVTDSFLESGTITPIKSSYTISVNLTDDGQNNLTAKVVYPDGKTSLDFVNSFSQAIIGIGGSKNLTIGSEGGTLTLADIANKYTFTLKSKEVIADLVPNSEPLVAPMPIDNEGNIITSTKNGTTGDIYFGTITFDKEAFKNVKANEGTKTITYVYEVSETGNVKGVTNDTTATKEFSITVKLNIADNKISVQLGDGTVTKAFEFTNTYNLTPKDDVVTEQITMKKSLYGRPLVDQEFTFELVDTSDSVVAKGHNDVQGTITFEAVKFTEPGTYNYFVREVNGNPTNENGVTYDTNTFDVTAIVKDNKDGTMSVVWTGPTDPIEFINTYGAKTTAVTLSANKNLTGRDLVAEEFTFNLKDDNYEILQTVKNDAMGGVTFEEMKFEAEGEYVYYIEEVKGSAEYVKYDSSEYKVTINVDDNLQGSLVPTIKVELVTDEGLEVKETAMFVNKYEKPTDPKPTPDIIIPNTATKVQ